MTATLWQFWEGGTPPPIIKLCMETVARHNPTTRVVDYQTLRELGGGHLIDFAKSLPFPQQSDLYRLWLLHNFGGCWVDTDSIALAPLDWLDLVEQEPIDLVGTSHPRGWNQGGLVASPFGCSKGSPLIAKGLLRCKALLRTLKKGGRVPYGASSVGVLANLHRIAQREDNPRVKRFTHWKYHRIPWYLVRRVFSKVASPRGHESGGSFNPNAQLYHLTNVIPDMVKGKTEEDLLSGKTFLSFLLQKALGLVPGIMGRTQELCKRIPNLPGIHGVEVGVCAGMNLRQLAQQKPNIHLTGIDPWTPTPRGANYRTTKDYQAFYGPRQMDNLHKRAQDNTRFARNRIDLLRLPSMEALPTFEDRSLDFVFIDGNHSLEGITQDLQWFRKVKPGGWFCGHDYNHPKNKAGIYGVNQAVDTFVAKHNLNLELGVDWFWAVQLP